MDFFYFLNSQCFGLMNFQWMENTKKYSLATSLSIRFCLIEKKERKKIYFIL